jgi:hypothetical protein
MPKRIALALLVLLLLIQLWPVERTNPPVSAPLEADPEVVAVLRAACYDCHSNETVWPWYSRVAPLSWQVAHHVEEGREELNFSEWGSYTAETRREFAEEMLEEIEEGEMPLWDYELAHPEARLDGDQVAVLRAWARGL